MEEITDDIIVKCNLQDDAADKQIGEMASRQPDLVHELSEDNNPAKENTIEDNKACGKVNHDDPVGDIKHGEVLMTTEMRSAIDIDEVIGQKTESTIRNEDQLNINEHSSVINLDEGCGENTQMTTKHYRYNYKDKIADADKGISDNKESTSENGKHMLDIKHSSAKELDEGYNENTQSSIQNDKHIDIGENRSDIKVDKEISVNTEKTNQNDKQILDIKQGSVTDVDKDISDINTKCTIQNEEQIILNKHSSVMDQDKGIIVGNVKVIKSQSGSEVLYENIGAMDLSVDLERVETMEDCIFFDTVESIEDDHLQNFVYDKNSLLDSGINADELLCGTDVDSDSIELGDVCVGLVGDVDDDDEDCDRSSKEDEEVELIMKSSDILDRLGNELKRTDSYKRYEDVNIFRKRSKSTDETSTAPSRIDFARYGISIGIGSANDLLPGIEEFLSNVLAKESLSQTAEDQRLYFLERLDIIKLPPSIPPRPQSLSIRLYPLHSSPPSAVNPSIPSDDPDDFAAYQRELSRALISETSPEPEFQDEVKVYDDIDLSDISFVHEHSTVQTEEESVYEIPQAKIRNLNDSGYERAKNRTLSDSGYEKAIDVSQVSTRAVSLEALDVLHSTALPPHLPPTLPPPLPPRRDRASSDVASRSSIGSIFEDRMLELSQKIGQDSHNLSMERTQDTKSDRSSDDILDEGTDDLDGLSYDSMDDTGSLSQLTDVQLPRPTKKRKKSVRRRMVHSLSGMKEVAVPLKNLEDVLLTGELHYRSKLTWTRKIVALTNGRMICYKPDKAENRPSFVILLTGYNASFQKREGKRNFEINLTHENFESHMFLADFKEWAETWCEYIKYSAQGKKPPGPLLNLTRGSSCVFDSPDGTYQLGKSPIGSSGSNLSLASSDGFDTDPGTVKVKKRDSTGLKTARMGSFAFRATQFFESLGKKSSIKKTSSSGSEKARPLSATLSQSSLTEESATPLTPESGIMLESPLEVKRHIKHQGYLDIYSSFNKRKWGKRWCMIQENNFECYRTQTSEVIELEFMLHDCILRRAIEETKSELGLMLLENSREKITIEPMNWTELGSWLRVLMRETSTADVPEGLAGYMDDTNPYHEAVEVTRLSQLSDPFTLSPTAAAGLTMLPGDKTTATSNNNDDDKLKAKNKNQRNRDSGNCSSESMDGRFGSLDRLKGRATHPGYTDSSLPRVSVPDSGDIYTQIRKHSVAGSATQSTSQNQSLQRCMSEGREPTGANKTGKQMFDFNFDVGEITVSGDGETEGSLVDEIMSQFRSRISPSYDEAEATPDIDSAEGPPLIPYSGRNESELEHDMPETFKDTNSNMDLSDCNAAVLKGEVSSDKAAGGVDADTDFKEVLNAENRPVKQDNSDDVLDDTEVEIRHKLGVDNTVRKTSSLLYGERGMVEVIEELRTRLVQLKKDRISIRDRKQKVTSEIDRGYLEAEFNRLNRECDKVAEEIKYLEKMQKLESIVANKESSKASVATGAGDDHTHETLSPDSNESSNGAELQKDKTYNDGGSLNDNDDDDIVIEMVSKVCDNVLVPKAKHTEPIFETVQESIVSNTDLVHKPNIVVDANVIIVEPDTRGLHGADEIESKGNSDNEICEKFDHLDKDKTSSIPSPCKAEVDIEETKGKVINDSETYKMFDTLTEFETLTELEEDVRSMESVETERVEHVGAESEHNQKTLDLEVPTSDIKEDSSNNENGVIKELADSENNQKTSELDVPTSDIKDDSSDSENGVIKDLAEEFEHKLSLKSDSDC